MIGEVAWRCHKDTKPLMEEVGVGGLVDEACDFDTGDRCLHPAFHHQSMSSSFVA